MFISVHFNETINLFTKMIRKIPLSLDSGGANTQINVSTLSALFLQRLTLNVLSFRIQCNHKHEIFLWLQYRKNNFRIVFLEIFIRMSAFKYSF